MRTEEKFRHWMSPVLLSLAVTNSSVVELKLKGDRRTRQGFFKVGKAAVVVH